MRKKVLAVACTVAVLASILLLTMFSDTGVLLVLAADSHGNDINYVEIWQWEDSTWVLRHNLTSGGGTHRISDSQYTNFIINTKFNTTLAESESQAQEYTRVTMNITGVWNNEAFNKTGVTTVGDFYILEFQGNWTTSLPVAGQSYNVQIVYEGYY